MIGPVKSEAICGEILPTPGARKPHAAFVKQGQRILFMFPVDSPQEGEAKIGEALALLKGMSGANMLHTGER
jgi:hypothetical protein